jgi:hypothetical protein
MCFLTEDWRRTWSKRLSYISRKTVDSVLDLSHRSVEQKPPTGKERWYFYVPLSFSLNFPRKAAIFKYKMTCVCFYADVS